MINNPIAISAAEQKAYDTLACPVMLAPSNYDGSDMMLGSDVINNYPAYSYMVDDINAKYMSNAFETDPLLINAPTVLTQEEILINASQYNFDFAANSGPKAGLSPGTQIFLNNVTLSKNNVAAIYGIRFRLGYDDAAGQKRVYQTYPAIAGDRYIYNGVAQMKMESMTQVDPINMDDFLEVPIGSALSIQKYDGCMLMNPIRILSGQLGKLNVFVNAFNSAVSGLVLSENAVIQCTLFVVTGQASASNS